MTQREIYLDTSTYRMNTEELQSMENGKGFVDRVSEKDKRETLDYFKTIFTRYKDNRSRYFFDSYVNAKKDETDLPDIDTLTSECSCYLNNDTIKVKMGIWIFGGFGFSINLFKDMFASGYWINTHKQNIFKFNLSDTSLSDNVFVPNLIQNLTLFEIPRYQIGEEIIGYLSFKTNNYYR